MSSPDDPPADILRALRAAAASSPDRVPLTILNEGGPASPLSVESLGSIANARAASLASCGVGRGELVLLVSSDPMELIQWFLGCVELGAVPAIYPARRDTGGAGGEGGSGWRRMARLIDAVGIENCVVPEDAVAETVGALPDRCRVVGAGSLSADARGSADRSGAVVRERPGAPCFVQLTSGSGGLPRAILHTHARVVRYMAAKAKAMSITADDIVVSWLPLYHDLGLVSGVFSPLVLGARSVVMSPSQWVRNPVSILSAITEYRGTMCFMPNFAFAHLARTVRERDLEGVDLSSVRTFACGGEPIRAATLDEFRRRFAGVGLRDDAVAAGYGMAEMIEGATVTPGGRPVRVDEVDRRRLEREGEAIAGGSETRRVVSCGRPLPGCDVRVVDDGGTAIAERLVGEVQLRSDYMLDGYLGDAKSTSASFSEGWLRTGDLGYVADGELYVVGRSKDVIIVAGRNVSPDDIEALADGISGLRPGRNVAFGVSDSLTGTEKVVLVCETSITEVAATAAIERELRRRAVDSIQLTLGRVVLVPPGWVTKTTSGKLARPVNRDRYLREFSDGGGGS